MFFKFVIVHVWRKNFHLHRYLVSVRTNRKYWHYQLEKKWYWCIPKKNNYSSTSLKSTFPTLMILFSYACPKNIMKVETYFCSFCTLDNNRENSSTNNSESSTCIGKVSITASFAVIKAIKTHLSKRIETSIVWYQTLTRHGSKTIKPVK